MGSMRSPAMAKTITALLVGIAHDKGLIASPDDQPSGDPMGSCAPRCGRVCSRPLEAILRMEAPMVQARAGREGL